jgi:hypothetical protein
MLHNDVTDVKLSITYDLTMLRRTCQEFEYRLYACFVTRGAHNKNLQFVTCNAWNINLTFISANKCLKFCYSSIIFKEKLLEMDQVLMKHSVFMIYSTMLSAAKAI